MLIVFNGLIIVLNINAALLYKGTEFNYRRVTYRLKVLLTLTSKVSLKVIKEVLIGHVVVRRLVNNAVNFRLSLFGVYRNSLNLVGLAITFGVRHLTSIFSTKKGNG